MNSKSLKIWNIIFPIVSLGVVLAIWAIAAKIINAEIIVPSLDSTFNKLISLFKDKSFYEDIINTLSRAMVSYIISLSCALILAVLSKMLNAVKKLFSTFVVIMRTIPTMSIILLAIIWMSTLRAPMFVAFLIIFPVLYTNILGAIDNVDPKLVEMANVYKVPKIKQVFKLYIPEMSVSLFSAVKSTISLNLKLVIAAEVMAQTKDSIGLNMQLANIWLETGELFAWTIVAIVLGAILEGLVLLIQKSVIRGEK